jgi:hypothetical protein
MAGSPATSNLSGCIFIYGHLMEVFDGTTPWASCVENSAAINTQDPDQSLQTKQRAGTWWATMGERKPLEQKAPVLR